MPKYSNDVRDQLSFNYIGDFYFTSVYASLVMITGKVLFGFILGNIASTLANAEVGRVHYEEKLGTVQVLSHALHFKLYVNEFILNPSHW